MPINLLNSPVDAAGHHITGKSLRVNYCRKGWMKFETIMAGFPLTRAKKRVVARLSERGLERNERRASTRSERLRVNE